MEEMLLKTVKNGTIIIMDNAKFHRSKALEKLANAAGCSILFLPPYSPDLNPIEQFWSWLQNNFKTLDEALMSCLPC